MTDLAYNPVADLVRFNEIYNDDGSGGPWTLKGREFVVEEIFKPLHSYNRVPTGFQPLDALCDVCRLHAGTWVYDAFLAPMHEPIESCVGLVGVPIINTGADVPRQSGKTTTGLSIPYARMFLDTYEDMSFVASAEDQSIELVIQKLAKKIERHPALKKLGVNVTANKIEVPRNFSQLEIMPASHGSVTGRTKTLNEYDECRDHKARVVTAAMPSILAQHGYKCPKGHGRWKAKQNGEPEVETCPARVNKSTSNPKRCGMRLVRFHARQLLLSASGVIEGIAEKDWFRDWIDARITKPDAFTHVYRTDKKINPSVSADIHKAITGSFGDVAGMKDHINVEMNNVSIRLGEDYMTPDEIKAVIVPGMRPVEKTIKAAVAFLDTSKTGDKTSLVILVDASEPGAPIFDRVDLAHVTVWDPQDREMCPEGIIDEAVAAGTLDEVFPRFPGLLAIGVDTRLMRWAKALVMMRGKAWSGRLSDTEGWAAAINSVMYLELLQRVRSGKIRLFGCLFSYDGSVCDAKEVGKCVGCQLRAELGAMRKRDLPGGGIEVYDVGGTGKDGRARKKGAIHRDIGMALAGACYKALEVRIEMPSSMAGVDQLDKELAELMPKPVMRDIVEGKF